jgi:putative transposase
MTGDMMNLRALLGRSAGSDFLRELFGLAAQPLMAPGVGGLTGAGAGYGAGLGLGLGGKSDDRLAQRNGHREQA